MNKTSILGYHLNSDIISTLIVTAAILLNGIFAYLLQLLLGRFLTVEDFGSFTVLLSMLTFLSFVAGVATMALIKMFSELSSDNKYGHVHKLFKLGAVGSILFGVVVSLVLVIYASNLNKLFKIDSPSLIPVYALYFSIYTLALYIATIFQGLSRFVFYALYIVCGGLIRLAAPLVLFLFLEPTSTTVYFGLFLGLLITILVGYVLYLKTDLVAKASEQLVSLGELKTSFLSLIKQSIPIAVITGTMVALTNLDVLLVKYNFTQFDAGIYSGVITMGKILVFGSGAVATVMYPRIVSSKKDSNTVKRVSVQFLALQLLFIGIPLAIYLTMPGLITHLLFGSKYDASAEYLSLYAVFIASWVLSNFFFTFFIAMDKFKVAFVLPFFVLLQYVGIMLYHQQLLQVVHVNVMTNLLLLIFATLYYLKVIYK